MDSNEIHDFWRSWIHFSVGKNFLKDSEGFRWALWLLEVLEPFFQKEKILKDSDELHNFWTSRDHFFGKKNFLEDSEIFRWASWLLEVLKPFFSPGKKFWKILKKAPDDFYDFWKSWSYFFSEKEFLEDSEGFRWASWLLEVLKPLFLAGKKFWKILKPSDESRQL